MCRMVDANYGSGEPGTTPYLKQVLNDLVSTVREVKTENSEIRASLANSRAVIDGLVTERNVYEAKSMGQKEELWLIC